MVACTIQSIRPSVSRLHHRALPTQELEALRERGAEGLGGAGVQEPAQHLHCGLSGCCIIGAHANMDMSWPDNIKTHAYSFIYSVI